PRSCRVSLGFSLISRPLREKTLNFLAMPPHQPLRVQHARTILVLVPRRPEPPAQLPGRLQPELQQPQQAHRHPLRLTGPLDRVGRPRPALLPADRPLPSVDEGGPDLPLRLPPAAPAGRLQPLAPLELLRSPLPLGAFLGGRGKANSRAVAPQAGDPKGDNPITCRRIGGLGNSP